MPINCLSIPAGTSFAGYRIESELGRGNNAVVYQAEQLSLGRKVALKILLPELAAEPGYIENFLREARMAARLDHPYIVQAYNAGATSDGYYYFAMELVIGPSIEKIRRNTPELLTFEFLFRVAIELAEALDYAWTVHHMTHGDIKPGNLLISKETKSLKLADLGLAQIGGTNTSDEIMATPLYAAPEVIRGEKSAGVKSDLYSFGIMLYELLCGLPPFVGSPQKVLEQHLYSKPQPLAERNPDLDPELIAFVEQLIDKDPAGRPENWEEVRNFFSRQLARFLNPAVPLPEPPPETAGNRRKRIVRTALVSLALAISLAVFGLTIWVAFQFSRLAEGSVSHRAFVPFTSPEPPPQPESEPKLSVRFSSPAAVAPPERKKPAPLPAK